LGYWFQTSRTFFPRVVRGVEDKATKAGYNIVLGNSDNRLDKEALYLKMFLANRMDGIVWLRLREKWTPNWSARSRQAPCQSVLLDREYSKLGADSVSVDNIGGGYMATQHSRTWPSADGIIGGIPCTSTTEGRFRGYQMALKEAR